MSKPRNCSTQARTTATYDKIADDYLERWRNRSMVHRALERFVALAPSGGTVLDVGCGPGFDGAALRERGMRVVGLDRSPGMLAAGRRHFPGSYVLGDMRFLPFGGAFDGLWVNASMLHIERGDVEETLDGFWRVLRPGGVLYLSLKKGSGSGWLESGYGGQTQRFFTFWEPDELDAILDQVGFTSLEGWENKGESAHWLNRLLRKEPSSNDALSE
jgi:SAM-dependent methyltransferase